MSFDYTDEHFRSFTGMVERAIARYGDLSEETVLDRQKRQVETLVDLERAFKDLLWAHSVGPQVYGDFIHFIVDVKRNILAARPFFRERQKCFTDNISGCLKTRNAQGLNGYRVNYPFIRFAVGRLDFYDRDPNFSSAKAQSDELRSITKQIEELRQEIVELNLPLAISRARLFWSKTPRSQLSYMDLVQISCEGLLAAIDKFVPPFARVFRAVAIGRITGNFIEEYSETLVHFYPSDRRKLYRANKLAGKKNAPDFELLANQINAMADTGHHTTPSEIADLMAAASCVSTESTVSDSDGEGCADKCSADDSYRPDVRVEHEEAVGAMLLAISQLDVFEQKFLKMKGVSL